MSKRQRRVRHPRRADRRHRRRRGAVPDAPEKPRDDGRPGPRAGAPSVAGQPRLLRPVRARPDREHPAQGGRGRSRSGGRRRGRRGGAGEAAAAEAALGAPAEPAERALVRGCSSFRRRRPAPPSAAPRTGWSPTRPRPPPTSTPSTGIARWWARPTGSSRRAWRSAWRRSGSSPGRSTCSGSAPRSRCSDRARATRKAAVRFRPPLHPTRRKTLDQG